MKCATLILLLLAVMTFTPVNAQKISFNRYFTGGTLRIDCQREGSAQGDTVWISRFMDRAAYWHGSRTQMLDPIDNGDYRVVMRDAHTGKPIYSRTFSNLFREYKDTPKGRTTKETFEETFLMPMPKKTVEIALQRRNDEQQFVDQYVQQFNPDHGSMVYNPRNTDYNELEINGPTAKKIDVVIVAQGYENVSDQQLMADFNRMKEILFGKEPFKGHRNDFNVYGVKGDVDAEFNTFGIDRYLMTQHLHKLHDVIGTTPCDFIIIMVNSDTYGGGAIYNFYAVSSLHRMAEYVLPHEFGHSFGGLADEYVDEDLSYADLHRTGHEPLEPNITNLKDFGKKWMSKLKHGTPVPTPDNNDVPKSECGPLGVYEGAGYSAKDVYRPTMHCMMRNYAPFCPVCTERLEVVFKLYTR